jgi:hypothetical protein
MVSRLFREGHTVCDVSGVDGNDAGTSPMRGHHHSIGLLLAHAEFRLEHSHDKLSWRVVIVDQDDLVKARSFRFRSDLDARLGNSVTHRGGRLMMQ